MTEEDEAARSKSDAADQNECCLCMEPMRAGATKCTSCGTFQNWRRHLNLSTAVLSLLVALVSVSALAVPLLIDAFEEQRSKVSVEFSFASGDYAYLYVANDGPRPALLESIVAHVGLFEVRFPPERLTVNDAVDVRVIREDSTEIFRLDRRAPLENGLAITMHPEEAEAYLDEMYQWNVDGYEIGDLVNMMGELSGQSDPSVRLQQRAAEPSAEDFELIDLIYTDLRSGLYRLQDLAYDLSYDEISSLDLDEFFDVRTFDDVRSVVLTWSDSFDDDQRDILSRFVEAARIVRFVDETFATEEIAIEVSVHNSDGQPEEFSIALDYADLVDFLRPLMIGRIAEDEPLLGLFQLQE